MTKLGLPGIEGAAADNRKEDRKVESFPSSKQPLTQSNLFDAPLPELEYFSAIITDSLLDFDFFDNWSVEENPEHSGDSNMANLGGNQDCFVLTEGESGPSQPNCEAGDDGIYKNGEEKLVSEKNDIETALMVIESDRELGDLNSFVEEHLGKVSLDGISNVEKVESLGNDLVKHGTCSGLHDTVDIDRNKIQIIDAASDGDKGESDSADDSEGESSSSSSSASSSSESEDEEEEEEEIKEIIRGKKVKDTEAVIETNSDMEEGEIMLSDGDADEMVAWSDDEDADGSAVSGPIRSKNEIQVLPHVPAVNVALKPHHQTQPVGTILSMIGAQVVVEGVEKHDPLNEGSILWITETRLPLGIVDEIFGPVKSPYYIVRYNSENEIPANIQQGTAISYVPEFANHVLNDKNLYKKGYDASNVNDEELSEDVEFSDDEKEAEYRKMLKMKKRGTSDSKPGPTRNERKQRKNQTKTWNQNHDRGAKSLQDQEYSSSSSSGLGQNRLGNQPMVPQIPQRAQTPSSTAPNGNWPSGITQPPPPLPPQGLNLPNGLPPNGMLWMQQNPRFPLYQAPLQPNPMLPQQINAIPGLSLNFNPMGGQLNPGNVAPIPPWSMGLDPNLVNLLQFQIGLQTQNVPMPLHMGGAQGVQSQGVQNSQNTQVLPEIVPANFNQGRGGGGGGRRVGHHRGRGGRGRAWNHR